METPDYISALRVVGGNLALDFANTAEGTLEGKIERENILSYEDLVFWGYHVGILSGEDGERLLRKGRESPVEAHAVFARALGFRGHLYGLFRAVAEGKQPPTESVEALRRYECETLSHADLVPSGGGFAWGVGGWGRVGRGALADCARGDRAADLRALGADQGMRRMQLALRRREQEQEPSLVLDGRLRHPRKDAALRRAPGCQAQRLPRQDTCFAQQCQSGQSVAEPVAGLGAGGGPARVRKSLPEQDLVQVAGWHLRVREDQGED